MNALTISELANKYGISRQKMVQELELVPKLRFNEIRKKGRKVRVIFPIDLKRVYEHLGNPFDNY